MSDEELKKRLDAIHNSVTLGSIIILIVVAIGFVVLITMAK